MSQLFINKYICYKFYHKNEIKVKRLLIFYQSYQYVWIQNEVWWFLRKMKSSSKNLSHISKVPSLIFSKPWKSMLVKLESCICRLIARNYKFSLLISSPLNLQNHSQVGSSVPLKIKALITPSPLTKISFPVCEDIFLD